MVTCAETYTGLEPPGWVTELLEGSHGQPWNKKLGWPEPVPDRRPEPHGWDPKEQNAGLTTLQGGEAWVERKPCALWS